MKRVQLYLPVMVRLISKEHHAVTYMKMVIEVFSQVLGKSYLVLLG